MTEEIDWYSPEMATFGDRLAAARDEAGMLAGLLNVSMMWLINGEGEGLADPEESAAVPEDVAGILAEVRVLKANMQKNVEKLGRLEKRLRLTTARNTDG